MDARRNHRIVPQSNDKLPAPHSRHRAEKGPRDSLGPNRDDESPRREKAEEIVILIPVFNDWASLAELLPRLDQELSRSGVGADFLIVDDGSLLDADGLDDAGPFQRDRRIDVLRLRRNLGHQRAIAVGLAYIEDCLGERGRGHGR